MTVVFYSNQISERGTETAILDYAEANEKYLHNTSIISFPYNKIENRDRYNFIISKYKILPFKTIQDFKIDLYENNVDLFYAIVDGEEEDITDELSEFKTFVHCVFSTRRRHGTYYCAIHPFLNRFYHTRYPVLPHIVKSFPATDMNLRKELGIPEKALVFGSYAGKYSFNIDFVHDTIIDVAAKNRDIYFIFMNIYNFVEAKGHEMLPNIIFLEGSTDMMKKAIFINTVTAMVHARKDGETFGLTVAEFSTMNKPIITYKPDFISRSKDIIRSYIHKRPQYSEAHLMNLGKTAILYSNKKRLSSIFTHFSRFYSPEKNYDVFSKPFAPESVISTFNRILTE